MTDRLMTIPGWLLRAVMLLGLIVVAHGAWAATGKRVALVVGNAAYADRPLANPVNDARLMQSTLREIGFEVQVATNVDRRALLSSLREFEARAREADVAVFYFAGHGAQVGGSNYLIPVNAPIRSDSDLPDEAVDAASVLRRLEDARARVALVILDACRDNPFPGSQRSAARGLARMNAPTGTIVAYATAPGSTADDGAGSNGTYTAALARHLATPGLDIKEVFDQTAQEVERLTNGRQRPREDVGLRGRFVLREAVAAAGAGQPSARVGQASAPQNGPGPKAEDREDRFWESARLIANREAYEAYLKQYPAGQYAPLARAAIARLATAAPLAAVPVTPPALVSSPAAPAPPSVQAGLAAPATLFRDCDACPEMVVIPGGRFQMGSAPGEDESEGLAEQFRNRSQPERWVDVNGFAAGRFEVTRGQYQIFAEETGRVHSGCSVWNGKEWAEDAGKSWRDPGYVQDDGHPVTCVNWEDAKAYTEWLSRRTGKAYRLLSEAEWEYAARAGTTTRRYWGDDGSQPCGFANGADFSARSQVPGARNLRVAQCDDGYAWTAPVGRYRPNAFGLYDMLGNVWEWVADCWNGNYAGAPADGRAWTSGDCYRRVVRGGSWFNPQANLRAAFRFRSTPSSGDDRVGFRVARSD